MLQAWLEVLVVVALSIISGVFAMTEIAVLAARRARLQQRAAEGDRGAKAALELAADPERFLSTVQVGITAISIIAGAFGGATLTDKLDGLLARIDWLSSYSKPISFTLVVLFVTFLTLLLGELVPKRIALLNAERIAASVARPVSFLARIASPLVGFLSFSTSLVLRSLQLKPQTGPPVTEEEIRIMLKQGQQAGVFEKSERDIVERVLRLDDRRVSSIMTPRADVVWVDIDDPIGDVMRQMTAAPHTYFPVCRGSIEHVVGVVSVKDQWVRMVSRQTPDITATLKPPLFVPESVTALDLLEQFKQSGKHVALVIDEYGSIGGMVTINDVLEAIVGDIPAGERPEDRDVVQRSDGSWLVDGLVTVDRLGEICRTDVGPGEEEGSYETLAGLLMARMGRIPRTGDVLDWKDVRFEVVDMDGHRVDKVLITLPPPTAAAESEASDT